MSKDFDIHEWHLYQANLNLLTEEENEFDEPINVSDKWNVKELGVGDVITPDMWDEDKLEYFEINDSSNPSFFTKPHKITRIEKTYFDFIWFENGKYENFNFVNNLLKPQYKVIKPSLDESDDEWDITTDSFDVTELGVGDIVTPNMWEENTGWSSSRIKILNIRYSSTDNNFVVSVFDLGDYQYHYWYVDQLNDYLKPQYRVTPPLTESDEDWDIDVDSKWNLSPEDEELLSHYNGEWEMTDEGLVIKDDLDLRGTNIQSLGSLKSINGGLDLFDSEIKSLGNLQHVGDWLNLRGTKIESLGNLKFIEGNLYIRDTPLARKYTEEQIRQMVDVGYGIYGLDESIDESDDNFDDEINVSGDWGVKELSIGDVITPDMWNDNYKTRDLLRDIWRIVAIDEEWDGIELKGKYEGYITWSISSIQDYLKPQYKIVENKELFEQDDFDDEINVSDMWNETNLWDGDIITPDMWVDDIDDYDGYVNYISGGKLKSFKDKNWTLKYLGDIYFELKFSSSISAVLDIVEIQKLLKPHYKLTPPLTESDDDFDDEINVSDMWNEINLWDGDVITPDMWIDDVHFIDDFAKYISGGILNSLKDKNWTLKYQGEGYFTLESDNGVRFNLVIPDIQEWLKPQYIISSPLNESDDEWNVNVSDMWGGKELKVGDKLTPEMFQDNTTGKHWSSVLDLTIKKIDWKKNKIWVEFLYPSGVKNTTKWDLEWTKRELIPDLYYFNNPLNESDEDWNVNVDNKWNVKTITTGDTFKVGNSVYILGEFSEGGKRVDVFKNDLSNPLNTTVKLLQSKLGDEYEIIPPVNESDDEWDVDVSNEWNLSHEDEKLLNHYDGEWEMTDKGLIIKDDLDLFRTNIKSLGNLVSVDGSLNLSFNNIESFGKLQYVVGDLNLYDSEIESLGNLQSVGGHLNLYKSEIISLGNLRSVGGSLILTDTNIESLGNLRSIGGNLDLRVTPLDQKYTEKQIRQMVNVKGKILGAKPSLNESNDEWDVDVKGWDVKELTTGDIITPDMWKDDVEPYWKEKPYKILDFGEDFEGPYVNLDGGYYEFGVDLDEINYDLLKPQYKIIQPLSESEEDWNIDVDSTWNLSPEDEEILRYYNGDWEMTDKGLVIKGDLYLKDTNIKSLGNLISVGGFLSLPETNFKSLGKLTSVGGWLYLQFTDIESLGNLQSVGGWLSLRHTKIESLGNLRSVGGDLFLEKTPLSQKYTEEQIRQMVDVKGEIIKDKPSLNESDVFDDEFDVNNDWNVTYLSVGDEFNIDMFKDEYSDWWDDMKYTEYTITKFYTWDWDGDYVIDFKGKDNVSYFMGVDSLNNYLEPEYRIVEP